MGKLTKNLMHALMTTPCSFIPLLIFNIMIFISLLGYSLVIVLSLGASETE